MIFEYKGALFPQYLKEGNAARFIAPVAELFCQGRGIDVGCGKWPLKGAEPLDLKDGGDAMALPGIDYDFVFSSHCLEHIENPVAALEHWRSKMRYGGTLFLYLPHPDMTYWLPQNCRKHLHAWKPKQMAHLLRDLGFKRVVHSERDMAWSFCCVGYRD
jgi:SAM-dependent methyltransferase